MFSLVIRAIHVILNLAIGFIAFFEKLLKMLCRFGDFLDPLTKYADISRSATLVLEPLTRVYGTLLNFYQGARGIFVDSDGKQRKSPSWCVFSRFQWDFKENFRAIKLVFQHHLDVLQHETGASILSRDLALAKNEEESRDREIGMYCKRPPILSKGDTDHL